MDEKDKMILAFLRKNARETLTSMSKKTNIPISTIYERLKAQSGGLIRKHTSLIDFSKLGFMTRANILMKFRKGSREEARTHLKGHAHINSLYKVNNGYDFMAEGVFRHICDLEEFLEALEDRYDIEKTEVYYIIDDITRERFLSDPDLLDLAG